MSIRYVTTGDEKAAAGLFGEGRHQLSILKNAMTFQNLQQLQRIVEFDDGTIIKCISRFGQDVISIYAPTVEIYEEEERKIVEILYCWCNNYFTVGTIIEKIEDCYYVGDYGEEIYPDCCNSSDTAIKNYNGTRYKVRLCQGSRSGNPAYTEYICLASDFTCYSVGERVIVFMRGVWSGSNLNEPARTPGRGCKNSAAVTCVACRGRRRPGRQGTEADGSYLITHLQIKGVNAKTWIPPSL